MSGSCRRMLAGRSTRLPRHPDSLDPMYWHSKPTLGTVLACNNYGCDIQVETGVLASLVTGIPPLNHCQPTPAYITCYSSFAFFFFFFFSSSSPPPSPPTSSFSLFFFWRLFWLAAGPGRPSLCYRMHESQPVRGLSETHRQVTHCFPALALHRAGEHLESKLSRSPAKPH